MLQTSNKLMETIMMSTFVKVLSEKLGQAKEAEKREEEDGEGD
jgi:hypothetical protein